MNKKDKIAFLVSCAMLLLGLLPLMEGEAAALIVFWPPVVLYWLYRYLNKDISFIKQRND